MAILQQVTEGALREMAREASSMHLNQGTDLTEAVVKVASAYDQPLTSEHVRRVCEMTYHDVFERSFRGSNGPDRVVSFDPPEATKVAAAVRARQISSFRDKVAAAPQGEVQETEKAAAAPVWMPERPQNAFSSMMAGYGADADAPKQDARAVLTKAASAVTEAERTLRIELGSIKNAQVLAYRELGRQVRQEVINGFVPEQVLSACTFFMKQAGAPDEVVEDVLVDLARDMLSAGSDLNEKRADLGNFAPNASHPLCSKAAKVADLRSQRLHREYALEEVLSGRARVERELRSDLFQ